MRSLIKVVLIFSITTSLGCVVAVREQPQAHEPISKVAVCHKNKKTMYIDSAAVKGHLGHGDYLGPCM
jgi:hypothetical protein